MELYAKIDVISEEKCHRLSCVINDTALTPLKWLVFVDQLNNAIVSIGKDETIQKFYMYFDVTFVDILMKPDNYKDIVNVFKQNYNSFSEKLLGTFIYIDSNILNAVIHLFMKFYSPVRPLFILKTKTIDQTIVNDLLENRKNINEYEIK